MFRHNALNEVYAHAVLGKHPFIVGYYSSWAEDDRIFVQTEYCNGGNLSTLISDYRYKERSFTELELKQLTAHIASGLKYIHAHGLVHLDIKPGIKVVNGGRYYYIKLLVIVSAIVLTLIY